MSWKTNVDIIESPVEHARLLLLSLDRGEADTYLLTPVLGDLNWRPLFLFKVKVGDSSSVIIGIGLKLK
eukprot:scaffold5247_cov132-Skeletonema_dohrnii-CCMP3373.AAC.4